MPPGVFSLLAMRCLALLGGTLRAKRLDALPGREPLAALALLGDGPATVGLSAKLAADVPHACPRLFVKRLGNRLAAGLNS
jgi:hypothetical protein